MPAQAAASPPSHTYRKEYALCDLPECTCRRGNLHGPFWFAYWRDADGHMHREFAGVDTPPGASAQERIEQERRRAPPPRASRPSDAAPGVNPRVAAMVVEDFRVLGLDPKAATAPSADALKAAYRRAALENHPDHGGTDAAMQRVNKAYARLKPVLGLADELRAQPPAAARTGRGGGGGKVRRMRLADLKRLPVGTRLLLVHTLLGPEPQPKLRVIHAVHSGAIEFTGDGIAPGRSSWLQFPKARDFRDDGDGFTIFDDGHVAAQYRFAPPSA